MPDNDYVPSRVAGRWRKAATALAAGRAPEEVGHAAHLALAASIRHAAPAPLQELAVALQGAAAADDPQPWRSALQEYGRGCREEAVPAALREEGEALLETRGATLVSRTSADVALELGAGALDRYTRGKLLGHGMVPLMRAETGLDADGARAYMAECVDRAGVEHVARQLTERPGAEVRAAPRRGAKPSMADFLAEEIS